MKITLTKNQSQRGNVLLVSIVITGIAALTLASFLSLTGGQNSSVTRSQNWNAAIPIVEAGIEEALTHLNDNCTFNDITHPATNWGADGWTTTDIGVRKTTALPGGSYYTVDIVTVSPYSPFNPAVVSEGHIATMTGTVVASPVPFLAQIGTQTTLNVSNSVARKVSATCGATALFSKGLVAKDSIDMHGNPIQTDSYDSTDPAYSTGGLYDPTKHKANGDIAVVSGLLNSLNIGNANIYGHAETGPGGSMAIGANGAVGDLAWQGSGQSGIEPGFFADDMNVYFPDVKAPFTGGFTTPGGGTLTNAALNMATITNTVTTYPSGMSPVITNTVTVTTTDYPTAGTYVGTPTMNTATTTTTTYPTSGTYVGAVITNTANSTSSTYPSSGYIGTPITNTTSTTTAAYPGAGTYVGAVTTNTTSTSASSYPSSGTYLGAVQTNTTPASSGGFPSSGTYIGAITTNCSSSVSSSKTYPAAGTYCPSTPPWLTGNSTQNNSAWNWYPVTGYSYSKITGYTFNQITSYTYNKVSSYSYQGISSYTYQQITGWTWAKIVSYTYYTYTTTTTAPTATYYQYAMTNSGNYQIGTLSGNVIVTAPNVVLYVTDSINTDSITIAPGASLKLYTSAPSVSLGGNGIWNAGGYSTNFMYYGLPSNTSISLSGNAGFTGTIYAPEANFTLNGGGNNTLDFMGASVAKTTTLNGHFHFHYDEALRKMGPVSAFAIQSWNEIPLTKRY
jgi:hypothetical protein